MKLKPVLKIILSLFVTACLIFTIACGKSTLAKVAAKSKVIVDYIALVDIPGSLQSEGLITAEEAAQLRLKIEDYRAVVTDFNNQIQAAVEANANIALFAPIFAQTLQRLNEIGAFNFANPNAQIKLASLLSKVKIASTVISGFFAVVVSKVKKKDETFEQTARRYGVYCDSKQIALMLEWSNYKHLNAVEREIAADELSALMA